MPKAAEPAPAENGGPPKTELQELQMKAGQVTDEHLENSRHRDMQLGVRKGETLARDSVSLATNAPHASLFQAHCFLSELFTGEHPAYAVTMRGGKARKLVFALWSPWTTRESEEAGARTINSLGQQGEQLDRIEEGMDQINADMREAEKNLAGMEKCCGICVLPCNKTGSFKEDEGLWKGNDDGKVVNNQPQRVMMDGPNGMGPQGGYIGRITNDAREEEMEDNMGQVNTMIGNLRNMAIDMGSELGNQNSQIDRINRKGESSDARIANANQRANKLLK
ncbi:hypothetical protein B566_EDAN002268 [Ephemera danica]|nr:hypothetical protein B566_EDAN002268 [Ephemera danica]